MAETRSGFDQLVEDYPVFVIKNVTTITRHIPLADNHDVGIPALSERPIESKNLIQMPNSAYFKIRSPEMKILVQYGIIKTATADPAPNN